MLTAEVLEGFVGSVLAKNFDKPAPIPQCHREWWQLCTSKERFVAIAAPRGHAKSTAITHCYTLASVLFRQRQFVLIVSDTETQAVLFLQDIRKELEDNEDLTKLFGLKRDQRNRLVMTKDSESDIIVQFEDGKEFRIMAKGSEQKVRGLKWGSKRPDLIICDDLENDEIVLNKDRRDKFKRWFNGALVPCRSVDGIIRIVGTVLHLDSLLETLMPEEHDKKTVITPLKVWSEGRRQWKAVKYRAHDTNWEHFLWPEKHSKKELSELYKELSKQGLGDVYYQEYLNMPIDESSALFKRSDFLPMKKEDYGKPINIYCAIDLAISEKQRADWTVFAIGGVDADRRVQIRNIIRGRMDAKEIVDTIIAVQKVYNPICIAVEDGAIAKSVLPYLYDEMSRTNVYPNLELLTPSKDKYTRVRAMQAKMRAGGVKFDKDGEWYPRLEEEMTRFPRDRHDDQVDAMGHLGFVIDKMIEAPTSEQLDDITKELELEQSRQLETIGMNAETGY